jgi:hypothetical protein
LHGEEAEQQRHETPDWPHWLTGSPPWGIGFAVKP